MFKKKPEEKRPWRNGVYLTTANTSMEADILESKLRGEGIPCEKYYKGASNAMEIIMGQNVSFPIELYVPEECLEDAKNIIVPMPLTEDEFNSQDEE